MGEPTGIKISPVVRTIVGAAIAALTAALTVLADNAFTIEDAIIITLAFLGTFVVVPPQVGGTQHGVVSPDVTPPPPMNQ